jgi:anthraniloyl-CoA monooxygenase
VPRSLRVAVLGGGPAGLTAARMIKAEQPHWQVDLFERNLPEETYGYGVGLRYDTLQRLSEADPAVGAAVEAAGLGVGTWTFRRGGDEVHAANQHGLGLARSTLLAVLGSYAERAGVRLHSGRSLAPDQVDADVVIAADGVGSATRISLAEEFGALTTEGRLSYMWCGSDFALDAMVLALVDTPCGPLAAHVMPYGPSQCTFQVDAHEDSLASWGLDRSSDGQDITSFLETQFSELLGGHAIETKRSEWSAFVTVTCERWSVGRVVLAGDAAHTAHYTVGSGTGMAIDDGISLAEALVGASSSSEAFESYEATRRPAVEHVQRRAARSQLWWTTLASRINLPLSQLMVSYLTRTGALKLPGVVKSNAALLADCLGRRFDGIDDLVDGTLAQPLYRNGFGHPSRVFHETIPAPTLTIASSLRVEDMQGLVSRAQSIAESGAAQIRLVGPPCRDAVLDRLDAAEHIRACVDLPTIVSGPVEVREDLALGRLSNRTDLVEFTS